jgi:hypothetical protein
VVQEILAGNSSEVSGQGEGAHDPAVPVDDRTRYSHAFVHQALDWRLRLVDVRVSRHQDAGDRDDGKCHLKKEIKFVSRRKPKNDPLVVAF